MNLDWITPTLLIDSSLLGAGELFFSLLMLLSHSRREITHVTVLISLVIKILQANVRSWFALTSVWPPTPTSTSTSSSSSTLPSLTLVTSIKRFFKWWWRRWKNLLLTSNYHMFALSWPSEPPLLSQIPLSNVDFPRLLLNSKDRLLNDIWPVSPEASSGAV